MAVQVPQPAPNWIGSKPEWNIFWALTTLGYKPDVDFVYQSPQAGGRGQYGGAVLDFLLLDLNLAINVHSVYWHYQGVASRAQDDMVRAMVTGWGITIIYIDEEDALRDPIYYTKEAIVGQDHSRVTGR